MEPEEFGETVKRKSTKSIPPKMTLQKAVDFGEYDPKYLSTFPEWHEISKHVQFQFIKTAIENRKRQLLEQYAAVSNVLDFRLKPELTETLSNIQAQLRQVDSDFEKISIMYFK